MLPAHEKSFSNIFCFNEARELCSSSQASTLTKLVTFQGIDFDSRLCSTSLRNVPEVGGWGQVLTGCGFCVSSGHLRTSAHAQLLFPLSVKYFLGMLSLSVVQLKISHEASRRSDDAWRTSYTCRKQKLTLPINESLCHSGIQLNKLRLSNSASLRLVWSSVKGIKGRFCGHVSFNLTAGWGVGFQKRCCLTLELGHYFLKHRERGATSFA